MKTSRLEKTILLTLCMWFCYANFAEEINSNNDDDFLWFAELSVEEAELFTKQDPEELEKDLESAQTLFAKTEIAAEQRKSEYLTPGNDFSEDSNNETNE